MTSQTVETVPDNDAEARAQFGRMLGDALKSRGMKQEDLARALGTTQSSVSGWIHGKYEPAAATVFGVELVLALEPGFLSRPLGYLPVEPAARAVSVEAAIAQSSSLDNDAKAALAALYRVLISRKAPPGPPPRPLRPPTGAKRPRVVSAPSSR